MMDRVEPQVGRGEPVGVEMIVLLLATGLLGLLLALPTWVGTRWDFFFSAVVLPPLVALGSARAGAPIAGSALGSMLGMAVLALTARGAVPLEGRGADLPLIVTTPLWALVGLVVGAIIGLVVRDLARRGPEVLYEASPTRLPEDALRSADAEEE